jgi:hypothetical protein
MKCYRAADGLDRIITRLDAFARFSLGDRTSRFVRAQCLVLIEDKPIQSLSQQGANHGQDAE